MANVNAWVHEFARAKIRIAGVAGMAGLAGMAVVAGMAGVAGVAGRPLPDER